MDDPRSDIEDDGVGWLNGEIFCGAARQVPYRAERSSISWRKVHRRVRKALSWTVKKTPSRIEIRYQERQALSGACWPSSYILHYINLLEQVTSNSFSSHAQAMLIPL